MTGGIGIKDDRYEMLFFPTMPYHLFLFYKYHILDSKKRD